MPRKLRLEYPGANYHVMSRANGKGNLLETDVDRQDFLKTLAETCAKTGFQVHAYCLMRHHFHLVIEIPQGNLVAGMRWLLSAYTLRFNPRHHRFGARQMRAAEELIERPAQDERKVLRIPERIQIVGGFLRVHIPNICSSTVNSRAASVRKWPARFTGETEELIHKFHLQGLDRYNQDVIGQHCGSFMIVFLK
jgi:REP element-mobilizing transposase RayT